MSQYRPWRGQPQETPLTFVILLAYAVLMYPGHRGDSDLSLAQEARRALSAVGFYIQAGEPWRLVTHAFVHGGLVHVLFNGVSLFALGPAIERLLGTPRFALLYLVGALAGGVAGVFWHGPVDPLVGGSGALFAMMGAVLALNMRAGRHLLDFLDYAGPRSFIGLVVGNLVLGAVLPQISNAAHLGGLVGGFVLTFSFFARGRAIADRVSNAARAAWVVLLCTTTLYACWPTARIDHLWLRARAARDPAQQQRLLAAIALLPERELSNFEGGLRKPPAKESSERRR